MKLHSNYSFGGILMGKAWNTNLCVRIAKAILVLSFAVFATLVVFGNVTDYNTNFQFVKHVLSMDQTFNDDIMYRAITNETLQHIGYIFIICVEAFIMISCWIGGISMLRQIRSSQVQFNEAKKWGIIGFTAGLAVWFLGFQAIAGEWFGMWMNEDWNGIPDATRLTLFLLGALIFLTMRNDDLPSD